MQLALITINTYSTRIEYLGIERIAAYLRSIGEKVDIFDFQIETNVNDIVNQIENRNRIFGFSLFHTNANKIFDIAIELKKRRSDILVFVGGYLATSSHEFIFRDCPAIDFVVLGDGEYPLRDILIQLRSGKNICDVESIVTRVDKRVKKPSCADINKLPWPDRDYIEMMSIDNRYIMARISSSKGCCGNCTFCQCNSFSKLAGVNRWQGRSSIDVFNEIKYIYLNYGVRSFSFNDGSIEDPGEYGKERLIELCDMLIAYPVKFHFQCFVRAESFGETDGILLKKMRAAGFSHFLVGIESANESELRLYNKRATVVDNEKIISTMIVNDIDYTAGFILFNPYSTLETLRMNHIFLTKYHLYHCCALQLEIYYGSEIYKIAEESGLLKSGYSYLNPTAYYFKNKEVEIIYYSIVRKFEHYKIERILDDFNNFLYFFYSTKIIYPKIYHKHSINVYQMQCDLSNTISNLMHYFFYKTIDDANNYFPVFVNQIEKFKLNFNMIRMQIMNSSEIKHEVMRRKAYE